MAFRLLTCPIASDYTCWIFASAAEDEGDGAIIIMNLPRLLEFLEIREMPPKLEA
jgi:hypothetical protein